MPPYLIYTCGESNPGLPECQAGTLLTEPQSPSPKLVAMQTHQELMVKPDVLELCTSGSEPRPLGFLGLEVSWWWSLWVVGVWKGVGASREGCHTPDRVTKEE